MSENKCRSCGDIIPPEWVEQDYDICRDCNSLSECCGAYLSDSGMCSDCKEYGA